MSAYLCFKPRIGTVEAERMVISNIHKGGIPPLEAGAYLGTVVEKSCITGKWRRACRKRRLGAEICILKNYGSNLGDANHSKSQQ